MAKEKKVKNTDKKEGHEDLVPKSELDKIKKEQNKQVFWFIVIVFGLIICSFFGFYFKENYIDNYNYYELRFTKTKLGDLIFYSTRVPVLKDGKISGTYAMNFRNDPRKLEYINVSVPDDKINFYATKPIYLAIDKDLKSCDMTLISLSVVSDFLNGFGKMEIYPALMDKNLAKESNISYATCESNLYNTVIEIKSGNETKIEKIKDNCYKIQFADCEVNQVSEKFIIEILKRYMVNYNKQLTE
jgi:hypothetical protein